MLAKVPSKLLSLVFFLVIFFCLAFMLRWPTNVKTATTQPNVLLIVTDDQPDNTLWVMPNVQRLFVREGRNYVNGYASTAVCCPARTSIMTGLHVHNHGVISNIPESTSHFPHDTSVQATLQNAGYRTGLFGKFLNGWEDNSSAPFWSVYKSNDEDPFSSDEETGANFKDFVSSADGEPWFALLGFHSPHIPWNAGSGNFIWKNRPPSLHENTKQELSDKPPYIADKAVKAQAEIELDQSPSSGRVRQSQLRELSALDKIIGGIFDFLSSRGEDNNTVAFFISDQGYLWGQHSLQTKFYPYGEVLKIPYAMRWPKRLAGGTKDEKLVSSIDIAPTIYQAAQVKPGYQVDGRPLLDSNNSRSWLYAEMLSGHYAKPWRSYITPKFQYIETRYQRRVYHEYYDLLSDPWQMHSSLPRKRITTSLSRALAKASVCKGPNECH